MGWQVIIAPSARTDLADIVRYITQHNSDAAARLGFELITRAENLAKFPELGRSVPEFRQPDLREIICRSYRIIYRLNRENQKIQIVRFWHGARGFPHIPGQI
ncbi:MAG TPA: type II toxin-antitoxin system RelE/ParE family toxin [Verrucomicrobiae bacterium]|jgi:plasmid stabilization system protein ParE|nr:type II toxin-antitoxin system RelE/ParE family toxin [Verrucomicrobiae bacterium]